MKIIRDLPIRHKLTLLLLSVVAAALSLVSAANVVSEVRSTRARMAAKCSALAQIVAAQSGAALSIADVDRSGAQEIISDLAIEPSLRFAALFDIDGDEVVRHPVELSGPLSPPTGLGARFTDDGYLDVVEVVKLKDNSPIGRIYLRHSTDQLAAQIRRTILIASSVFLLALALTWLLSLLLQRFISTPILQLAQVMQRVSTEHNFSLRAEKVGNDELGQLCDGFNDMLNEIQRRDEELDTHRSRLEELVEQRTNVLQARTAELTKANLELNVSREALQAANKELEAFSYSVSHDLRAPLRAIDGFSRILLQDYLDALPEEAQEYLRDVRTSTQQMGHLVDDLLNFSRLSRQSLTMQNVAVDSMVRACLEELGVGREGRTPDVHLEVLPHCAADPALLKQVWINLLSNAIKYSGQHDAPRIEVGCRNGDASEMLTYFVKDNGVGFDMRYSHKLFGVFQRLHKAEDYPGTGVGLAIVQRVIHRHGGTVWAESEPGRGATFYFTLSKPGAADASA